MDEILRDFLVSFLAIGAIFGIFYVIVLTRHRERMALMDKGLTPKEFNNHVRVISATLRFGLLMVGVAIGILLGNTVAQHWDVPREGAFIAMMLFFGGISLIISYRLEKSQAKKY
jgi:preprotein translocase subunit YajC